MSFVFSAINALFDLFFWPYRSLHPLIGLAALSVVTGVLMLVAFRYTSDQAGIRRAKDRVQAHLLAVQLFPENLRVVFSAYARLLTGNLLYLRYTLRPLAVMLLPLLIVMVQLDLRLGAQPLETGSAFLLKARMTSPQALEQVSLRLPDGLRQTAPPVRVTENREINWRLEAAHPGPYALAVQAGAQQVIKEVFVGESLARLTPARVRSGMWEELLNMGEAPLPGNGPVERVEVMYPARKISAAGFHMHWVIPFFALSLLTGFALKGVVGAEF